MESLNASKKCKKTKLGYIPVDWDILEFSKIAERSKEKFNPNSGDEKQCIELENISQNTGSLLGVCNSKTLTSTKNRFYENDILFGKLRPYLRKFLFCEFEGVCSSEIWVLRPKTKDKCFEKYLFYLIQTNKFIQASNVTSGSKMPRADWSYLTEIPFPLPSLPEQKKIAKILSCWDNCIEKLEKVIELKEKRKKGLMQKLLTGKVRLTGLCSSKINNEKLIINNDLPDGWNKVKLNDAFERVTRKNTVNNINVLTISAQFGLISQKDYFNKSVAEKNLSNYILIQNGEFAYNKSYSNGYPMGAIKRLDKYKTGIVSTLYIVYKLKNMDSNSNYFKHYFDAGLLNEEIHGIAQEGARNHGLLNISISDFFNMKIIIPNTIEQKAIANVLDCADNELEICRQKLEAVKNQKKGLMQNLLTGKIRHPEFAK